MGLTCRHAIFKTANKDLLCSTRNSAQYSVITYMYKESDTYN